MAVRLLSPAKVNIMLKVGEIHDGFHRIISLIHSIALFDELFISENRGYSLECNDNSIPRDESNLVTKAVRLFSDFYLKGEMPGIKVMLNKRIPHEAGLGGGSSNAASVIKFLMKLYKIEANHDFIHVLAKNCGYDIPFFFSEGFALVKDFGETILPIPGMLEHDILLIKPDCGLSTPLVYQMYDRVADSYPDLDGIEYELKQEFFGRGENKYQNSLTELIPLMANDLQKPAMLISEHIKNIFDSIPPSYKNRTMMTGSGSCLFILLAKEELSHISILMDSLPKRLIEKTVLTKFMNMHKIDAAS